MGTLPVFTQPIHTDLFTQLLIFLKGDSTMYYLVLRNRCTDALTCVFEVNMIFKTQFQFRFGFRRTSSKRFFIEDDLFIQVLTQLFRMISQRRLFHFCPFSCFMNVECAAQLQVPGCQFWLLRPAVHQSLLSHTNLGCFWKCLFGILRNTEFYTELTLFRVIPQIFFYCTILRIPLNSVKVHVYRITYTFK